MTDTEAGRVVYTGTWAWWEIVSRDGEIVLDDSAWAGRAEEAAAIAAVNVEDHESWVCEVTGVADRHSAIRPGDYACCEGYGCDVIFVRFA